MDETDPELTFMTLKVSRLMPSSGRLLAHMMMMMMMMVKMLTMVVVVVVTLMNMNLRMDFVSQLTSNFR